MIAVPALRQAMNEIAERKGPFSLFGLFMPSEMPGRWELVVAAPWLEAGKLKSVGELIELLEDLIGEQDVRNLARVVTLKGNSPEIRQELAALNIEGAEERFYNTTLFGKAVDEAVILKAKPSGRSSPPNRLSQPTGGRKRAARG